MSIEVTRKEPTALPSPTAFLAYRYSHQAAVLRVLGGKQVLNYGVEHARFIAPVRCGKSLRCRISLAAITDKPDGRYLIDLDCYVEIEGEEKPALVAHSLMLITC